MSRRDRRMEIDRLNGILLQKMDAIREEEYTKNKLRPQAQNLKTLNAHTMDVMNQQITTENQVYHCFYFQRFTGFSYFRFKQQFTFFFFYSFFYYFFYYFRLSYFFAFLSYLLSYFFYYLRSYFFFLTTYFIIFNSRSFAFFMGDSTSNAFTDLLRLFDAPLCLTAGLPITLNFDIYFFIKISLLTTFI